MNGTSERSFQMRQQHHHQQQHQDHSNEYHRQRGPQPLGSTKNQNESSLRMFLEELKNEDNLNQDSLRYNYNITQGGGIMDHQHHRSRDLNFKNHNQGAQQFISNQSSIVSSENQEMMRVQEESFSKMQNEIASLQNKIKGLEGKLGPHHSQPQISNQQSRAQQQANTASLMEEEFQRQRNQYLQKRYIDSGKDNKENEQQILSESEQSSQVAPQTFPLRLKRQYLEQKEALQTQQQNLQQRYQERYEEINDSTSKKLQYDNRNIKSLTESEPSSGREDESSQRSRVSSTISVTEKMKKKIKANIKQKRKTSKSKGKDSVVSRHSLTASLKRSYTQDLPLKRDLSSQSRKKPLRMVRFSDTKDPVHSRSRSNSLPHELMDLRKQNAYLKLEVDKVKKQLELQMDYQSKYLALKHKYKQMHESYKQQEVIRKEQKELLVESKKTISKLKKKNRALKEKVKKGGLHHESEDEAMSVKAVGAAAQKSGHRSSYKNFISKGEEQQQQKQKSHRKASEAKKKSKSRTRTTTAQSLTKNPVISNQRPPSCRGLSKRL